MLIDKKTEIDHILNQVVAHGLELLVSGVTEKTSFLASILDYKADLVMRISDPFHPIFQAEKVFKKSIHAWFVLDGLRYSFDAQVLSLEKKDDSTLNLVVIRPDLIKFRETRKFIRIDNSFKTTQGIYVKDVSMAGLAVVIPEKDRVLAIGDVVKLQIGLPYEVGYDYFYRKISFKAKVSRVEASSKGIKVYGLEFFQLSTDVQSLLYQYILARKNEMIFQQNDVVPIKLHNIT